MLRRADYPSSLTFKVVVDYTAHPAMDYAAFVRAYPGDWAFVTAFVPAVCEDCPDTQGHWMMEVG